MENRIGSLIEAHSGGNISEFSRESGVPYGALYDIVRGKSNIDKVGIGIFMKIAHTLGMTAEELYYGTPPEPPTFADPQQTALNGYYECMNETGRKLAVDSIKAMSSSAELRMVKEREVPDNQSAMEA
ncbi:MAG: helix-turn-helix transcriptional regulator [Clostridia bacterium]|nr:helix-turn-helix transcriptional regulator [Clostridia bacterium]